MKVDEVEQEKAKLIELANGAQRYATKESSLLSIFGGLPKI